MKRKIVIILIIFLIFASAVYPYFVTVGRMSGTENEKVIIGKGSFRGEYIVSTCPHSSTDRGRIIGNLRGSYFDYYVYKTSCEKNCVYVASSGRGAFYMPGNSN